MYLFWSSPILLFSKYVIIQKYIYDLMYKYIVDILNMKNLEI